LVAVLDEEAALVGRLIDAADLREALRAFDPVWEQLTIPEQARVVQLLIERIDYDGAKGSMAITFRPGGVRTLATETATAAGARP
jgi:site-specific DNA recombinase